MRLDIKITEKLLLIAVAVILTIFGSFWDLNLSVLFVDTNSVLGRIYENHMLLLVFVPVIYAALGIWKVTRNNFYILGAAGLSIYAGFQNTVKYLSGFHYFLMSVLCSILLFGIIFTTIFVRREETLQLKLESFYKVLIVFASIVIVIHLIKFLNGRVRYRDFDEYISYSQFTNWYDFKLFAKGSSFPSGHTSTMYVLIPILAIYKKDTPLARYAAYGFVLIMALMRIRIGAHFLTDTMIGLIIAIVVELFVSYYGELYFERKRTSL